MTVIKGNKAPGTDSDAIHDNVSSEISAITAKGTPVGADFLIIEDSEDSNNKKSITVADLPNGGGSEFPDDVFRVKGSVDATKKMAIEVDGLTTATTRTATMPDKDVTLGGIISVKESGVASSVANATETALSTNFAKVAGKVYQPVLMFDTNGGVTMKQSLFNTSLAAGVGEINYGFTEDASGNLQLFVNFDVGGMGDPQDIRWKVLEVG